MSIAVIGWTFEHSPTKGTDRLVLLAIADSAEDDGTNAWPGVDTIARKAGITRRGAQQSIARLEREQRIHVEHQAGGPADLRADRRPNRYEVVMLCDPDCDGCRRDRERQAHKNGVHRHASRQTDGAHVDASRGESYNVTGCTAVRPIRPRASARETSISLFADRFDDFYAAYPRHEGKGAARRAWEKRIKAGADPVELIAGARRTAEHHAAAATEAKFIPLPATWLNGERETDELADPRRNGKASPRERTKQNIQRAAANGDARTMEAIGP